MKRYEKMSKEEIMKQYECHKTGCATCLVYKYKGITYDCTECITEISKLLNEEIEMIPKAYTFKTAEEAHKAYIELCSLDCNKCGYSFIHNNISCVFNWLYEEVGKE